MSGKYETISDDGRHFRIAPDDEADGTHVPCLRIGLIHVDAGQRVEALLGTPWQPVSTDGTAFAYLVYRDTVEGRGAYYVVTYERISGEQEQIAEAVQLTGDPAEGLHQFSCLDLGADTATVRRQLGPPARRESIQIADDMQGTVWYYDPMPFSLEIVGDRLYSIQVWRPPEVPPQRRRLSLLQRE